MFYTGRLTKKPHNPPGLLQPSVRGLHKLEHFKVEEAIGKNEMSAAAVLVTELD